MSDIRAEDEAAIQAVLVDSYKAYEAASDPLGPLVRKENVAWLQPLPDSLLDAGDPARAVIDRSSLRLAFAAALQHLSDQDVPDDPAVRRRRSAQSA
jgi:hypothetical protein